RVYKIDTPITGEEEPVVGDPVTFTPPGSNNTLTSKIAAVNVEEQKADLGSEDGKQKFDGVRWRDFQRDGVRIVQDQLINIFAGKLEERSVEIASIESIDDDETPAGGSGTATEVSDDDLTPPASTSPDSPASGDD